MPGKLGTETPIMDLDPTTTLSVPKKLARLAPLAGHVQALMSVFLEKPIPDNLMTTLSQTLPNNLRPQLLLNTMEYWNNATKTLKPQHLAIIRAATLMCLSDTICKAELPCNDEIQIGLAANILRTLFIRAGLESDEYVTWDNL